MLTEASEAAIAATEAADFAATLAGIQDESPKLLKNQRATLQKTRRRCRMPEVGKSLRFFR